MSGVTHCAGTALLSHQTQCWKRETCSSLQSLAVRIPTHGMSEESSPCAVSTSPWETDDTTAKARTMSPRFVSASIVVSGGAFFSVFLSVLVAFSLPLTRSSTPSPSRPLVRQHSAESLQCLSLLCWDLASPRRQNHRTHRGGHVVHSVKARVYQKKRGLCWRGPSVVLAWFLQGFWR